MVLHMYITKCSLGYELLCAVGICEPHIERGVALTAASRLCLLGQPGENMAASAASARRE